MPLRLPEILYATMKDLTQPAYMPPPFMLSLDKRNLTGYNITYDKIFRP